MTRNPANEMIQDLCRSPEGVKRLTGDREACFEEYGLDEAQREALREGTPFKMIEAGIHPILSMHYLFAFNPRMSTMMSIVDYPDLVDEDDE